MAEKVNNDEKNANLHYPKGERIIEHPTKAIETMFQLTGENTGRISNEHGYAQEFADKEKELREEGKTQAEIDEIIEKEIIAELRIRDEGIIHVLLPLFKSLSEKQYAELKVKMSYGGKSWSRRQFIKTVAEVVAGTAAAAYLGEKAVGSLIDKHEKGEARKQEAIEKATDLTVKELIDNQNEYLNGNIEVVVSGYIKLIKTSPVEGETPDKGPLSLAFDKALSNLTGIRSSYQLYSKPDFTGDYVPVFFREDREDAQVPKVSPGKARVTGNAEIFLGQMVVGAKRIEN